jgi:hypothetical protein
MQKTYLSYFYFLSLSSFCLCLCFFLCLLWILSHFFFEDLCTQGTHVKVFSTTTTAKGSQCTTRKESADSSLFLLSFRLSVSFSSLFLFLSLVLNFWALFVMFMLTFYFYSLSRVDKQSAHSFCVRVCVRKK